MTAPSDEDQQGVPLVEYQPRGGGGKRRLKIGQPPLVDTDDEYLIIERLSADGWVYDSMLGKVE